MAENPIRVAFCPLLYQSNGGKLEDLKKKPNVTLLRMRARGKCDEAFDCGDCQILDNWVQGKAAEGFHVGWECVDCLKETKAVPRQLPGYYQASKFRGLPGDRVLVEPNSRLDGCTRCGYGTSFLQLVLRK